MPPLGCPLPRCSPRRLSRRCSPRLLFVLVTWPSDGAFGSGSSAGKGLAACRSSLPCRRSLARSGAGGYEKEESGTRKPERFLPSENKPGVSGQNLCGYHWPRGKSSSLSLTRSLRPLLSARRLPRLALLAQCRDQKARRSPRLPLRSTTPRPPAASSSPAPSTATSRTATSTNSPPSSTPRPPSTPTPPSSPPPTPLSASPARSRGPARSSSPASAST